MSSHKKSFFTGALPLEMIHLDSSLADRSFEKPPTRDDPPASQIVKQYLNRISKHQPNQKISETSEYQAIYLFPSTALSSPTSTKAQSLDPVASCDTLVTKTHNNHPDRHPKSFRDALCGTNPNKRSLTSTNPSSPPSPSPMIANLQQNKPAQFTYFVDNNIPSINFSNQILTF